MLRVTTLLYFCAGTSPDADNIKTVGEETHSISDVDVRGWYLLSFFARLFYLFHIPNAECGATQLSPHITPVLVLDGLVTIREARDLSNKRTGHIDLVCMHVGQTNHGTNLGV